MRISVLPVWTMAMLYVAHALAADPALLSGDAFERQLQSELRVTWQNKPLREALNNLSKIQRIGIMLDRRVDPGLELNISLRDASLEEGLETIAAEHGLSVSFVGPLAYVGPIEATDRLATVAMMLQDQAEALPAAERKRLLNAESTVWPRLSVPRELCQTLAREHGFTLRGLERLPHDVWPEICLPPLTVIQRLTVLLGGFELACELSPRGAGVRIVTMPDEVSFSKQYQAKPGAAQGTIGKLRARFADATIQPGARDRFVVAGTAGVHRAAQQLTGRTRPSTKSVTNTKRVYTFNVENKRGSDIVRYLAQQWALQLEVDPQAEETLEKTISLSVKDASQDKVLSAILKPLKLQHELQGKRLMVTPE